MISSPNRSRRSGAPVRLVCIHTAEGARTVESLGRYFQNASVQASSHVGIDDRGIEQYVPYTEASWTLRSGNSVSDNAELCGFARWSRAEWVTQHEQMLRRTAAWIAERCAARGIPLRKLTPEQVRRGEAGVIGHHDWTVGMRDGTHTDPGPGFPWDVVMALASTGATRLPAAPPSPTPPAPREDSTVLENIPVHGAGGFRRIIPIGKASSILARAWVSLVTDGPAGASAKVFFQSDGGGLADRQLSVIFRDGWSSRDWAELPDGTTQIVVQYDAPDGAIVALEAAPK